MIHPSDRKRRARTVDEGAILDALRLIVRALRLSASESKRTLGVSGAQLFLLELLAKSQRCSLNELAASAHTDQSTASVVTSRLVVRGLVSRRRSEADGRRVELAPTAAGRALLRRAPEPAQRRLLAGVGRLPRRCCQTLAKDLTRLVQEMGMANEAPGLFFEDESAPRSRRGGS